MTIFSPTTSASTPGVQTSAISWRWRRTSATSFPTAAPAPSASSTSRTPIITVNATAYAALRDKLTVRKGFGFRGGIVTEWVDNGDGTYTFTAIQRQFTLLLLQ